MTGSGGTLAVGRYPPAADRAMVNKPTLVGFLFIRDRREVVFHA